MAHVTRFTLAFDTLGGMVSTSATELPASKLPDDVHNDIQKRLRRLEGQVRGVQRLLAEGAECREVVHQVAAAKAAMDRIGYRLVAAGMRYCVDDPESELTADDLERLFLKLA